MRPFEFCVLGLSELALFGAQTLRRPLSELQIAVSAIRADQGRTNELLEQVHKTQQNHGARLNAIDGRLGLIEQHTGMVKA